MFPHPVRDPQGHSFQVECTPPPFDERDWQECMTYLWAIDLFNHGYYWESHEQWEAVWITCGRRGKVADFLKGLIKLAAAGVKAREGRSDGVRRHAVRAGQLFQQVAAHRLLGLEVADLIRFTESLAADGQRWVDTSPEAVVRIWDFVLLPQRPGDDTT